MQWKLADTLMGRGKLNEGKAGGATGVVVEVLKMLPYRAVVAVHRLFVSRYSRAIAASMDSAAATTTAIIPGSGNDDVGDDDCWKTL